MPISDDQLIGILEVFPWAEWRKKLHDQLDPTYRAAVSKAASRRSDAFTFDDPFTSSFATQYVGERVKQLDAFTRENVSDLIRRVLDGEGAKSTTNLAELVAKEVREHVEGYETWRAARIARTETDIAYNHGDVLALKQEGDDLVDVIDGDSDEACAAANGQVWTVEEALRRPIEHPNCSRAFLKHVA